MSPSTFHIEHVGDGKARRYRAVAYVPAAERREGEGRRRWGRWRKLEREAKADGAALLDEGAPASSISVAQLVARYIAARALRPTTRQRYEHDLARLKDAEIGEREARSVLAVEWDEYFASLRDDLAPKSVVNLRGLLYSAHRWAVRGGLLAANPVADTDPPKVERTKAPAPTMARVQRALAVFVGRREEGAVILMGAGGLRDGEACARRWRDIDWHVEQAGEENVLVGGVRVTDQYTQTRDDARPKGERLVLHLGEPKSARGRRYVPLPGPALAMLADLKRRQQLAASVRGEAWSDERLVSGRRDGSPIPPNQLSSELGRVWRRAGLAEMHPHLLRHALITELIVRRGVDAQTAADLAGHSTPATTLAYYTHSDDPAKRAAAGALSRAWEEGAAEVSRADEHQKGTSGGRIVPLRSRKDAANG